MKVIFFVMNSGMYPNFMVKKKKLNTVLKTVLKK